MVPRVVVLDACVLFPASLRDALLYAAEEDLYSLRWTDEILDEVRRNLIEKDKANEQAAQKMIATAKAAFPEALIPESQYAHLKNTMQNHPKDRHVLAAAVAVEAEFIVTSNLRHFPKEALEPYYIEAISPDDFLILLLKREPLKMIQAIETDASMLQNPPRTTLEVLCFLTESVPHFVNEFLAQLPAEQATKFPVVYEAYQQEAQIRWQERQKTRDEKQSKQASASRARQLIDLLAEDVTE